MGVAVPAVYLPHPRERAEGTTGATQACLFAYRYSSDEKFV